VSTDDSFPDHSHSVTQFIERLKAQDPEAAGRIWQRYFERLLPLARARLRPLGSGGCDAEDVLVSVFDRFFRAAGEDRFARLEDRDDLWQILLMLTERTVADQYRRAGAQKRGGLTRDRGRGDDTPPALENVADREPGPEFAAAFNDSLARAIGRLTDEKTREVALLRMEGRENQEIAQRLEVSLSSVERKLRVVREVWKQEFGNQARSENA
jgi:RNA polymerase sigma factor (sigma-70 family)